MSEDKPAPPPPPVYLEEGYKGYKPVPQPTAQPAKVPPPPPKNPPNQGSGGKK